jgi:hypothetical protein
MRHPVSAIYHTLPPDTRQDLENCVSRHLSQLNVDRPIPLFFRADDIGVPGRTYQQMISLFQKYRMPLCLALVPCWLTKERFQAITATLDLDSDQWCFHQHGYRHINHEPQGKKQEFGQARKHALIHRDLQRGEQRLTEIVGPRLFPFFTPPWNRCGYDCLTTLGDLHFTGISRFSGASPKVPPGLQEVSVNLDLHTRKGVDPGLDWHNLLTELGKGLEHGYLGIMLHHQRMNANSLVVLEILLQTLTAHRQIQPCTFRDFK